MNIEQNVPLGRLTTVGIGGPARHFARPRTVAELEEVLRWAAAASLDVLTIGLGSNVLVADDGVDSLVLRLEGELAGAETRDGLRLGHPLRQPPADDTGEDQVGRPAEDLRAERAHALGDG